MSHNALTPHLKVYSGVNKCGSDSKTRNITMIFYSVMQWGAFCWYSNRPHLSLFSSLNIFLSPFLTHLYLYLGLCWISVKSRHLPNPLVPLCQAQPPTVDPAIESTAHDIIRARPTHSRNKGRPTFTPIPTGWPTFPNCIRYRILFLFFAHMVYLIYFKMSHQVLLPNWVLKTNRWIHGTLPVIIIIVIADAQPNH